MALGRNLGYQTLGKSEERLRPLVVKLAADAGQKISIIGWSMGGVMARHMARDYPELVRQVITLAAPFTGDPNATNVRHYYEFVTGDRLHTEESKSKWHANRAAPTVPPTAIFSKTDGVTAWQNCLEVETPSAENIEVCGSHMGLPHNPMASYAIADRLAQHEADWRPYAVARA